MPRHIAHIAMTLAVEPVLQSTLIFGQLDAGNADLLEAQSCAATFDLGGELPEARG